MGDGSGFIEPGSQETPHEYSEYLSRVSAYRAHPVAEVVRLVMEWTTPVVYQTFVEEAELHIDAADLPHFSFLARYERMHPSELARMRGIGPSAVSKLVSRLAAAEYVVRESDPMDRRATYIVLTPRGRAAATRCFGLVQRQLDAVISDWTPAERAVFARLVRGMSDYWASYMAESRAGALPSSLTEYII